MKSMLALLLCAAGSLSAATIGLWSTGVCSGLNTTNCQGGPGSLLNFGANDNNYQYTQRADSGTTGNNSSATEHAISTYVPDNSGSEWIGPAPVPGASVLTGLYIVKTTFDLTGFNAASLIVSLSLAVDNAVSLKVNGNSVTTSFTCGTNGAAPHPWCFETLSNISLTNANTGGWLAGLNTIEFDIQNNDTTSPTGLLVETQGNASMASPVPEPATWGLLGAGLVGLGLLRRKIA